jgi:hypothetical protein
MLSLTVTKRTDERLLLLMERHYSQPKGFVGRNICYAVEWDGVYYGHIVAGSATKFLPGRNQFFGVENTAHLVHIVNNIFFHIEPGLGYPVRNFTSRVVGEWRGVVAGDWLEKYGDPVWGFETLVELPRSGELYRRDGWQEVGTTHGYTCKRVAGKGTDSWTGKRVWDVKNLRPKVVLVKGVK